MYYLKIGAVSVLIEFLLCFFCINGSTDTPYTKKENAQISSILNIAECKDDIATYCSEVKSRKNFDLLDCLRGGPEKPHVLKTECEHSLWKFQMSVTKMYMYDENMRKLCGYSFESIKECQDPAIVKEMGGELFCLLDNKHSVKDERCSSLLNSLARIVFFDYATMKPLLTHCENDISQLQCGRVSSGNPTLTQDSVVACLGEKVMNLSERCHHQVLRIAELQADDYHLDRSLFFACRESREALCGKVKSGEGRVLKCLMDNKMDDLVSPSCRKQLSRRQTLRAEDYRTDYSLRLCDPDIVTYECGVAVQNLSAVLPHSTQKLAYVLLCLENADKTKKEGLQSECRSEILSLKKQLYDDLSITPPIMLHCGKFIHEKCKDDLHSSGLRCLLDLYRKTPDQPDSALDEDCREAVTEMLYLVDPSQNIVIDPVIAEACERTITYGACRAKTHSGYSLYGCLLRLAANSVDESEMDVICKEKMFQMNTILSQDYSLHDAVFRACHEDAVKLCNGAGYWYKRDKKGRLSPHGKGTFHCLYDTMRTYNDFKEIQEAEEDLPEEQRTFKKDEKEPPNVSRVCRKHLRETMKIQAARVDMNPFVYQACLSDLTAFCHDKEPEDAYDCLQENLNNLKEKCRNEVTIFSEEQNKNPDLEHLIKTACRPMVNKFCGKFNDGEAQPKESDILDCMVAAKNDPGMDRICRIGIEREQILALKDYHISHKFRLFCDSDVKKYCKDKRSKPDVIKCLLDNAAWDYVDYHNSKDALPRLKPKCRELIRVEMFQRSQDIRLDPELEDACKNDIKEICPNVDNSEVLNCLQSSQEKLSSTCHQVLFSRELVMSRDNRLDGPLMTACKHMVEKYCRTLSNPANVIDCLLDTMDTQADFDRECTKVLSLRLELRGRDYRLDPNIVQFCKKDIETHCSDELNSVKSKSEEEYQGRVLYCLRDKFDRHSRGEPLLTDDCRRSVYRIVSAINLHTYMDPFLKLSCKADFKKHCEQELEETNGYEKDGRLIECLKNAVLQRKMLSKECKIKVTRLLLQSQADVHTDPMLAQACSNELRFLCGDVALGRGQQLTCLLHYHKPSGASKLSKSCSRILDLRVQLWKEIGSYQSIDGIATLIEQIQHSSARMYIIGVLFILIILIFIQGFLCSRYAHKVPISWKNK